MDGQLLVALIREKRTKTEKWEKGRKELEIKKKYVGEGETFFGVESNHFRFVSQQNFLKSAVPYFPPCRFSGPFLLSPPPPSFALSDLLILKDVVLKSMLYKKIYLWRAIGPRYTSTFLRLHWENSFVKSTKIFC